jgi:hypothetical protein
VGQGAGLHSCSAAPGWRNGRRGGLKSPCPSGLTSSSLVPGTACPISTYEVRATDATNGGSSSCGNGCGNEPTVQVGGGSARASPFAAFGAWCFVRYLPRTPFSHVGPQITHVIAPPSPKQKAQQQAAQAPRLGAFARGPMGRFVVREGIGTAASVSVFLITRVGEKLLEVVEHLIPLGKADASVFLHFVFTWGAAIATAAGWSIITLYELNELRHGLGAQARRADGDVR